MAEDNTTTTDGGGAQAAQPSVDDLMAQVKALQDERDKAVAESRKWEGRSKSNSEKAKKYDELAAQSMTDAEKASEATKRAEIAEQKLAEYERERERAAIVAEVAADKGVDADWLSRMAGDGREAIEANADFIAGKLSGARVYPSVSDNGGTGSVPITREQIDAIKDPKERVRMRAQHLDLYK